MSEHSENLPDGAIEQVSPGVLVQRRGFLGTVAACLALSPLPAAAVLRRRQDSAEPWTLEEFLEKVVPVAEELKKDVSRTGQARYLSALASHAVMLGDVPVPELRDSGQGTGPGTWIGANHGPDPFVVLHWKMDPGTTIRLHAHTYGNVVTLGLAGEVRVRNFEMVGTRDFDAKGRFRVRRTVDQVLRPGDVNLVNLERNYIHGFEAGPDGARGLDITTRLRGKRPTPYLDLAARPADADERTYEATWTS